MDLQKRVGRNVRHWRLEKALSQEELAHRARLHPTYVSDIETGYRNPTVKVIGRIAIALAVDPSQLFAVPASEKK